MAVFVLHSANHVRDFVVGAERGRPVWDGQACGVAGDERSSNDQQESAGGREDGEAMQSAMVRDFYAFQDGPLKGCSGRQCPVRYSNVSVYQRTGGRRRRISGVHESHFGQMAMRPSDHGRIGFRTPRSIFPLRMLAAVVFESNLRTIFMTKAAVRRRALFIRRWEDSSQPTLPLFYASLRKSPGTYMASCLSMGPIAPPLRPAFRVLE